MQTTIHRPELTPEELELRMHKIKTAATRLILATERGERRANHEKHRSHSRSSGHGDPDMDDDE